MHQTTSQKNLHVQSILIRHKKNTTYPNARVLDVINLYTPLGANN
jgi:hypothetical protein